MNIRNIILSGLVLLSGFAVSCEEIVMVDPEIKDIEVSFPKDSKLVVNDGEVAEFTFHADSEWIMTASAAWCKLLEGEQEVSRLVGDPGENTIRFTVHGDALKQGDPDQIAFLELTDGSKELVVAQIVLSAPKFELLLTDKDGNLLLENDENIRLTDQVYELPEDGSSIELYVKPNFEKPIFVNLPRCLSGSISSYRYYYDEERHKVDVSDKGLMKVTLRFSKNTASEVAPTEGIAMISSQDGLAALAMKWTFNGYPDKVGIEGPSRSNGWNVNLEGDLFFQKGGLSTSGLESVNVEYKNFLPFRATTDVDYTVMYLECVNDVFAFSAETEVKWMQFDKETQKLTVSPSKTPRKGYAFAVEKHLAEKITAKNWKEYILREIEEKGPDGTVSKKYIVNVDKFYNSNCFVTIDQKKVRPFDPQVVFYVILNGEDQKVTFEDDLANIKTFVAKGMGIKATDIYQTRQTARQFRIEFNGGSYSLMGFFDPKTGKEVKDVADLNLDSESGTLTFSRDLEAGEEVALAVNERLSGAPKFLVFKSNK